MQISTCFLALALGFAQAQPPRHILANSKFDNLEVDFEAHKFEDAVSPKTFVVSLFAPEAKPWHKYLNFSEHITVPGLSPLFPQVSCTANYDICNVITGEGEINAAASIAALLSSPQFNLTETYFLVAGIAGINPDAGALGSAAFARYTVSVGLQYEVADSEKPKNWTTNYWPYGTDQPGEAPKSWYGTEAFEVNAALRDRAAYLASFANLSNPNATEARIANHTNRLYNNTAVKKGPRVLKCDSATSDVYFTGVQLANTFANFTSNVTNGTAQYCTTAQEDSAILEAALRNAKYGLTDFSRWVLLRTASDYDRPPAKLSNDTVGFFLYNNTGGADLAFENLYRAGFPFINDVIKNWNSTYLNGTFVANATLHPKVKNGTFVAQNYVGDVFGTLGGKPDFGPGSYKDVNYI